MTAKIKSFGEVMMRLEAPHHLKLEQTKELRVLYSGTGVNFLGALSKYGHDTSLITKLPANNLGDAAYTSIQSYGISTENIIRGGDYLGMYFLEQGFHVRPTKVTYSNRQESSFCTSTLEEYQINTIFKNTNMIHFCGITLAVSETTRRATIELAKQAKELGITVIFDNNYRPKLWNNDYNIAKKYYEEMLYIADICFMSDKDAKYLLGFETKKENKVDQVTDLLTQVAQKYNIQTIACTIKEQAHHHHTCMRGFILHEEKSYLSKKYTYEIFDRIGTGDGFASGIIHGLIHHFALDDLIEFSTAAGVLAHTTYGDIPISTTDEIWNVVHQGDRVEIER